MPLQFGDTVRWVDSVDDYEGFTGSGGGLSQLADNHDLEELGGVVPICLIY